MRRKEANPNKAPEKVAEKKEKKAQKEAERKAEDRNKQLFLKYGTGFLVVLTLLGCVYSGMTIARSHIPTVNLGDQDQLKDIFFSGEPWLLHCSNENMTVSPYFVSAAKRASVSSKVRYGVIDCGGKLPSNRTLFQRFKIKPVNFTSVPTSYLFANGEAPVVAPSKYATDAKKLSDWAEKYSKPAVKEVAWSSTFQKLCLDRPNCVMLHTKAKYKAPAWLTELQMKHRSVKFVSINRKMHKTSFDDEVRVPRAEDTPRLAIMTRKQSDNESTYTVTPHRGEWKTKDIEAIINQVIVKGDKHKDSVDLDHTPWFDAPPKGQRDATNKRAQDKNKAWREERRKNQQSGGGGDYHSGGGGGKQASKEEAAEEEEKRRLEAARSAEAQLEDDDDVVVSDIDDDDDTV